MAAPWKGLTDDQRQTLTMVGVGVVGAASVLGGMLWVIRRQIVSGDVLKVRLVHELEPDTEKLVRSYYPLAEQVSEKGVDVNMRLFRRKAEEEGVDMSDLIGALAPLAAVEAYGKKTSSGGKVEHPLPGAASFSRREGDLWFPVKVELDIGGQMVRGFVEAGKMPLRNGGWLRLYKAGKPPSAATYVGRYQRTGTRGFSTMLKRVG